jgi:hypothetical protein
MTPAHRETPQHGPVRRRADPDLLKYPQAVKPAGLLDDPGQHKLPKHPVAPLGWSNPGSF